MPLEQFREFHERLKLSHPKRSFRLHGIDRPGLIIPVGHHLSIDTQYHCVIQRISCAAAVINISRHLTLPKNFFLVILGSSEEIGATEISRSGDVMIIRFNMFLDAGFLETIVGAASLEIEPI